MLRYFVVVDEFPLFELKGVWRSEVKGGVGRPRNRWLFRWLGLETDYLFMNVLRFTAAVAVAAQ